MIITKQNRRLYKRNTSISFKKLSSWTAYKITFKAWDVYNNPITAEIQLLCVGDDANIDSCIELSNPFVKLLNFGLLNRPFEPLEVQVQVMTITGKVVWTKNQIITTEGFLSKEITWDGKMILETK
jgi:hypothetical protein